MIVLVSRSTSALVARAFARTLARGGVGLLTDPGRVFAPAFADEAAALGLQVGAPEVHEIDANGTRQAIRLYTVRR